MRSDVNFQISRAGWPDPNTGFDQSEHALYTCYFITAFEHKAHEQFKNCRGKLVKEMLSIDVFINIAVDTETRLMGQNH